MYVHRTPYADMFFAACKFRPRPSRPLVGGELIPMPTTQMQPELIYNIYICTGMYA
jgi:hypothetical protein